MNSAIQKVEQTALDTMGNVKWTRQMVELCKRTVCPKGVGEDEFALFIEQCRATGFNPFTKEVYCVPRNVKVSKKGEPDRWETQHVFQPGVDGARARAGRFPDFHSSTSAAVFEKDACEVDVDAGEVRHKFNPCQPRGRLVGAWGKVVKRGGPPVVAWLPAGSRSGNSQFWNADPGGMLAKCAEMAALRKAYPVQFSGVQAREEVQEEAPSRAEQVLGAGQPSQETPPAPPTGPLVEFGEWKGRPISGLTLAEAAAAIAFAEAKLAEAKPGARWVKPLAGNLVEVAAHHRRLEALVGGDVVEAEVVGDAAPGVETPAREPGSDDGEGA